MADLLQVKFNPEASFLKPDGKGGFTDEGSAKPGTRMVVTGAQLAINTRRGVIPPAPTTSPQAASLEIIGRLKDPKNATGGFISVATFPGRVTFTRATTGVVPFFRGDGTVANNQRTQTLTLGTANEVALADYLFHIAGDGNTVELKNDGGPILVPLPWLFDENNPLLQLNARLTVNGQIEANENSNTPLDIPLTHTSVPDEAVAGDATKHPLLTFFGVRNVATMTRGNDSARPVTFPGKTLRVFFHATFRSFCSSPASTTAAAVGNALTTILRDVGFGAVAIVPDAAADTECAKFFRSVGGHFMSKLIADAPQTDQEKKEGKDAIGKRFSDTIGKSQQAPKIPDDLFVKIPFFDFFIFAENIGAPDPIELAHSELMLRGSGQVTAAGEKVIAAPIIISTASGDPLRRMILAIDPADHANLLATTVAHEIGHTLGLRHCVSFVPPAQYSMGDPLGRQRHVMASAGQVANPPGRPRVPLSFFGPVHRAVIRKLFF